jgi:hypothetical protein
MTIDFSKYIIKSNINQFRLAMIDTKQFRVHKDIADSLDLVLDTVSLSMDPLSYEDYTRNKNNKRRSILSSSVKWSKVEGLKDIGVTGLYLSPATTIQGLNTCKFAGECARGCIAFTGHLGPHHQTTIEYKTLALFHYTEKYLIDLLRELYIKSFKASIDGKNIYCRLNGSSDLPFYKVLDFDLIVNDFAGLAGFYDYTKYPVLNNPFKFYHLTYSYSETTKKLPTQFDRIAIVVTKKDKQRLLNDYGDFFVDGDLHDVRPLDTSWYVLLQGKRPTTKDKQLSDTFIQSYDQVVSLCVEGVQ